MSHWSRMFNWIATWFPRKPVAYWFALFVWAVSLWFLSEGSPAPKNGPEIPHVDKLAHFGYFFIGGGLMSAGLLAWRPAWRFCRRAVFGWVSLVFVVIGRLDEYHQGFTPGRSGNDTGDWIADALGAAAGACFILYVILPRWKGVDPSSEGENRPGKAEIVANSLD